MSSIDENIDKREFPRYEVVAYVDYTGSEVLLYHRIENISLGGICIQTATLEKVGAIVELVINFPDLGASFATQGEVVWSNHEPPMDMGIRFIQLDDNNKAILRRYIEAVKKGR